MIGYCDRCGCAIYTQDEVGFEENNYQLVSEGAIPHIKYHWAPVHELICIGCTEEEKEVPYCVIEATFQVWAEQECRGE